MVSSLIVKGRGKIRAQSDRSMPQLPKGPSIGVAVKVVLAAGLVAELSSCLVLCASFVIQRVRDYTCRPNPGQAVAL